MSKYTKSALWAVIVLIALVCTPLVFASTPSIFTLTPSDGSSATVGSTIEISANVTDDVAIDTVTANITLPNNTIEQVTLTLASGEKYNNSYTIPPITGQFTLNIIANDTSNNQATNSTTFQGIFEDPTNIDNLRLWLDASDNSTLYTDASCSTQVTSQTQDLLCWEDKSEHKANATEVSGKGEPRLQNNQFNGLSVVSFTKSESDTLRHELASQYTSDFTIFLVIQSKDASPETFESFFSNGEPASTDHFQIDYTTTGDAFRYGASAKFNFENFSNEIKLYSVTHDGSTIKLFNEGEQVNTGNTTEGRIFEHYRVNQNRNGDRHHDSYIGEVILYDRVLSSCERELINLDLGTKYGRDFFGTEENYGFGSPHNNDINGVGEFDSNCTTTVEITSAQSSIAKLLNPNSLDLNDVMSFAHDNGGFSLIEEAPENFTNRINQSWRVDEDNEPGNVSVSFNLSSTNIVVASSNFGLLIDSDTNFSNAQEYTTGLTIDGNTVTFTGVDLDDGEYFSLAVNEKTPTVEFVDPTPQDNSAQQSTSVLANITSNAYGADHYTFLEVDNDLVLWMRFDDVDGSSNPVDLSHRSQNGTLQNGASISNNGRYTEALNLDGTDDYVDLPDMDVDFSKGLSFCSWTYWDSHSQSWPRIFDFGQGQADDNIIFAKHGTTSDLTYEVRSGGSSGGQVTATSALSTDAWQHICATEDDSGNVRLYVDGDNVQNGTTAVPEVVTRQNAYIGRSNWGSDGYPDGRFDEIIMFNRTLSSSEISALHNATANQYENTISSLSEGSHTIKGHTVSANAKKNETASRTITIDNTQLQVFDLFPVAQTGFVRQAFIEIAANVTDNVAVDTVKANITYPNGSIALLTLASATGNKYNVSFTAPNLDGTYTVKFAANDTANNVNDSETSSFTVTNTHTPTIEFVDPTPANNTFTNQNSFRANMTSNGLDNDHYTFINFDNTHVFWMRFDDVNSSGDPTDIANGYNGSLVGDALINSSGRFGDAAHFDGSGDYVTLPASNTLVANQNNWTISTWFNANSVSSELFGNRIVTIRDGSTQSVISLTLGNDRIQLFYRDSGGTGHTENITDDPISTNRWYHYLATYNGSAYLLYVDGTLNKTITDSTNDASSHGARIGTDPAATSKFFDGFIDEVLIFNRTFSAGEVLSLYNATANQYDLTLANIEEGTHTYTGYTANKNNINQTEERTITMDYTPPSVFDVYATPTSTFNLSQVVQVNANVTDINTISNVTINITLPNGTVQIGTMSNTSGDRWTINFAIPQNFGTHNVKVIAEDLVTNSNSTETTSYQLLNDPAAASSAAINGGSNIDLTQGATTSVLGTATITDNNGYTHINTVTGYLFHTAVGATAANNNTNHYTTSCVSNEDGSEQTESYNCTFSVSHYAYPTDASSNDTGSNWTFLVAPLDTQNEGTNDSILTEVNTLFAFNITPATINFGDLNLGANTTNTNQEINVTNLGNVGLDITLSGTNLSCNNGLVPVNFLEYKDSTFNYGVGTDLLETGVELDLDALNGNENEETPKKTTYYGIKAPGTGVGGACSGTVTLTGTIDTNND